MDSATLRGDAGSPRSTASDIQVARPSFNHSSRHDRGVTTPPNQPWASSCAITSARRARSSALDGPSAIAAAIVTSPGFSIAPASSGTTTRSTLGHGHGRPSHATDASSSGARSARACSTWARRGGAITRIGTAPPGTSTTVNAPAATATR